MKTKINIKDYYSSIIATRKDISILKDKVTLMSGNEYIFDFHDISFISRSFADEFIKYLISSNIKWRFKNTNANIKAIFDAVKKSQKSTHTNFDYVAIAKFKSDKEFNQFLATF